MTDPRDVTYDEAVEYINDKLAEGSTENIQFFEGDHWQDGDGWVGPILDNTHPAYGDTIAAIQRAFTSQNVIREVVNRETMAAVGDIPYLTFILRREIDEEHPITPEENAFLREVKGMFDDWFQKQNVHEKLKEVANSAALTNTASMRLLVPPNKLEGGQVPRIDPIQIGDYLFVEAVSPFAGTVYEDDTTKDRLGVYAYEAEDEGGQVLDLLEKTWVEEELTIIRIEDSQGNVISNDTPLELNGLLPIFTIERPVLVTESVRSNQKQVNNTLTMMGRNVTMGGFLERIFFNAQMPGHMEDDGQGGQRFVPEGLNIGPGASMFIAGMVTVDSEGNEKITQPSAYYHDPTDNEVFLTSKDGFYTSILQETQQSHVLITSQTRVSGESRRQARAEFANQASIPAGQIVILMEWLAQAFFSFVDLFSGGMNLYERIKPVVEVVLDIGPLPAEEVSELTEAYKSGIISIDTAMARYDIKDIAAERAKISAQDYQAAELQSKRAETYLYLVRGGVAPEIAARAAGFSTQMARLIAQQTTTVETANPSGGASLPNPLMERGAVNTTTEPSQGEENNE